MQKQPDIIFKITTTSKIIVEMLEKHAQFLIRESSIIGVVMCVEPIDNGAILFYDSMDDFVKFLHVTDNAGPFPIIPKNTSRQKKPLTFFVEVVKKPAVVTADELIALLKAMHAVFMPGIAVDKKKTACM